MAEKVLNFVDDHLGLQIASCALLSLATIPIVVGSFCALPKPRTPTRRSTRSHQTDENDEEKHLFQPKVITIKDTFLFPVIISGLIYVVSSLTNTIHPDYFNNILTLVTALLFTVVFASSVLVILKNAVPSLFGKIETYHFSFSSRHERLCHLNVTVIHLLVYLVSIGLSITYVITQHWIIENLFAISIAIHSIRYLTLQSFGTGYLLLLGMLAYDVFWVFGTNTLVDLSKVLVHAPTSVVWPRNINTYVLDKLLRKDQYFTMYGLGEIIIPGIFIAYTLKYDQYKHQSKKRTNGHAWAFDKPYFTAALSAYVLGAAVSIYTVHFTKKSQSAFVYIVPALLTATSVTALVRNEFGVIYDGSDILSTFRDLAGYTEETRPTFEERLRTPRARTRSRSKSTGPSRKSPPGVVTEAFEETRNLVTPYVEETRKAMEPYIEEAVKNTKKAINNVAAKVQEQTTIEEDVVAEHQQQRKPRARSRGRPRSRSVARRPRGSSRSNPRKKAAE